MPNHPDQTRLEQLLDRLEQRAQQCPGLFPVSTKEHWLELSRQCQSSSPTTETLWKTLESFDRNPELAHQKLNHLLAQASPSPLSIVSENPKLTARHRTLSIERLLAPSNKTCQKAIKKSA